MAGRGWWLALVVLLAGPALAPAAPERLKVSWSGTTPTNAPLWVCVEYGLFRKHGVEVDVQSISASTVAAQALLAGEIDLAVSSVATLVSARLSGSDVVAIFVSVPTPIDHIVVSPAVRDVGDLRGKTGAVNRLGTTSDLGLRLVLRRLGLDPDRDVKLLGLGDDPARLVALKGGHVQFTILSGSFVRDAEKLGFRSLVAMAKLGIPFHWNATLAQGSVVRTKREPIRRFVRAMTEAIAVLRTDGEGGARVIGKYLKLDDPDAARRAWEDYREIYPVVPLPTAAGVATALAEEARRRPEAARADPAAFVEPTFVNELEASGFIAALYRR